MIEVANITIILIFEKKKKKLVVRSIVIKAEAKNVFDQKINGEKHITPMDFAEHLRKSDASENSKVYYMVDCG